MRILTYKCMLLILSTQSVTAWKEAIWVCCVKPLKVPQVHTQTHLERE